jgi:hypothetical protein
MQLLASVLTDRPLADRLIELLLRQARERDVPQWVISLLEQREEPREYVEASASTLRVKRGEGEELEITVRLVPPAPALPSVGRWMPVGTPLPKTELEHVSYIVIDEIVGDTVDVSISRWPDLDERGRLLFAEDESPRTVRASAAALEKYLSSVDFRSAHWPRSIRMGDVFAARVRKRKLRALEREGETAATPRGPSAWMIPPVYDITAQARDKAKEAFYAAVSPTLRPPEARAMKNVPIRRRSRR